MKRDLNRSDETSSRLPHPPGRVAECVYLVNATLLICHEIDSSHWEEWQLFRIPGGAEAFVALHVPIVAFVLWGLVQIVRANRVWHWYSLLLAIAGIGGGLLHLALLVAGAEAFATPFSITLIVAFLLASLLQLIVTL